MSNPCLLLTELVAEQSIRWADSEKFYFIWDGQLAVAHYDRDRKSYRILSYHDPEVLQAINSWLTGRFRRVEEEEKDETYDEQEEDQTPEGRDRSR